MNVLAKTTKGIFLAMVITLGLTTLTLAQYGQLEGEVIEAGSNKTLPGINIGIKGTTLGSATNAEGHFNIERIPAGSHTIEISAIGYQKGEKKVRIPDGETATLFH